MLFRSPTCSNLATFPLPSATKKGRHVNSGNCTPYIDNTNSSGISNVNKDEHVPALLPMRDPHVLQLGDGRYVLTFYDIHPIPEDKECSAQVYFIVRCGDYFPSFCFH